MGEAIVRSFAAQGARVSFVNPLEDAGAALASKFQEQCSPMTSKPW